VAASEGSGYWLAISSRTVGVMSMVAPA
jgi:hypothetical protein